MNLLPNEGEFPSKYCERLSVEYSNQVEENHKKGFGQFFTPIQIAQLMASLCEVDKPRIKILDPGCGVGILSCALAEHLALQGDHIREINLVVFEIDVNVLPLAEKSFGYLRLWLEQRGINLTIFLCKNDFILHNTTVLNREDSPGDYDIVISNPPYFKLRKNDERALAAKSISYGQSNIYSIFLIIAAKLLKPDGQLIFITPRSFCSGNYFRLFRELFFSTVDLDFVHLFKSRKDAFKKDKVLQENLIMSAFKKNKNFCERTELRISTSEGIGDISSRLVQRHQFSKVVNINSFQKKLYLPISEIDEKILNIFSGWNGSFNRYNISVSTGPVVDFRSSKFTSTKRAKDSVPLIWLHNIETMNIIWPKIKKYKGREKPQFIIISPDSKSRLTTNSNCVLVRRFSAKDDKRRLIAAPYLASKFDTPVIGIENHLNYIYRKNKEMSVNEVNGIAALLNSSLFDFYFRTFNGNTNVSATELRDFPLPDPDIISQIGQAVKSRKGLGVIEELYEIDSIISEILNLPKDLLLKHG